MTWRNLEPIDTVSVVAIGFYGWLFWRCWFGPEYRLIATLPWTARLVVGLGCWWLLDRASRAARSLVKILRGP